MEVSFKKEEVNDLQMEILQLYKTNYEHIIFQNI